nr:protein kinase-like domain-containing protein [Tanacetum cinerariifolium]
TLGLWKRLTRFGAGDCNLYGSIPHSIFNLSLLVNFSLLENLLGGSLPSEIGNQLPNIEYLQLRDNELTGVLPPSLSNCSKLGLLDMGVNNFSGKLTIDFSKLRDINKIYLAHNNFIGCGKTDDMSFIDSLKNRSRLVELELINCNLIGVLPISIGNLSDQFSYLTLGNNHLFGSLPSSIGSLVGLITLRLGWNRFKVKVPATIGKLQRLQALDLGNITSSLSECISLTMLNLCGNIFQGIIPSSLSSLRGLGVLDISRNKLSGKIPQFLGKWVSIEFLNLSFNEFEGEVPVEGVFTNASAFLGNNRLCGGLDTLELPKCKETGSKKKRFPFFVLLILIAPTLLVISYCVHLLSKNLIGEGGFSSVYKGILDYDDDKFVAIKVLHLQNQRAHKSFLEECEAWRNIRHRNLLKIITSCSSVDFQGNDFKALVYEFVPNGSVHNWIHSSVYTSKLNLFQRINILKDVATKLDYLHNRCQTTIGHGDLKPSNILLDADMVAHVGDFGLARLLGTDLNYNSSMRVKGTIVYAPPEYGLGSDMTSSGDVYSFGILLLVVMTVKRPIDDMFKNGLSLHKFAYMALPDHIIDVIDDDVNVLQSMEASAKKVEECLAATIKIRVSCSVDLLGQNPIIQINPKPARKPNRSLTGQNTTQLSKTVK